MEFLIRKSTGAEGPARASDRPDFRADDGTGAELRGAAGQSGQPAGGSRVRLRTPSMNASLAAL